MGEKNRKKYKFTKLNDFSHSTMDWIGSVPSLIIHTLFFTLSFSLILLGFDSDKVLLVVTTAVSLEAIYLAIFIQMAINLNSQSLSEVEEDIEEIQEDVDEIQKDVDEIQEDVDEIQKDVDEIQEDVDEIQKDVDEIQEDVDEIQEDVEEIQKESDEEPEEKKFSDKIVIEKIESQLQLLIDEIKDIKKNIK